MISNKIKGKIAEYLALLMLLLHGYHPVAVNLRGRHAEVDILAWKRDTLCLIEVKFRRGELDALTAIAPQQKQRLLRQANALSQKHKQCHVRIDGVFLSKQAPYIQIIENI